MPHLSDGEQANHKNIPVDKVWTSGWFGRKGIEGWGYSRTSYLQRGGLFYEGSSDIKLGSAVYTICTSTA